MTDTQPNTPLNPRGYEPPCLTPIGSLAELTQGGTEPDEPDGFGGAGASGSIPVSG